jgi:acyl carrier protein
VPPRRIYFQSLTADTLQTILELVQTTGKIQNLAPSDDFYDAGFSSINALQLLMELEAAFDVTIPDDEFVTARTCTSLNEMIARLTPKP